VREICGHWSYYRLVIDTNSFRNLKVKYALNLRQRENNMEFKDFSGKIDQRTMDIHYLTVKMQRHEYMCRK